MIENEFKEDRSESRDPPRARSTSQTPVPLCEPVLGQFPSPDASRTMELKS